jgi:nucleoside-diphosphate-sugar epimerase
MGFIEDNKTLCMLSVLINTHLLQASVAAGVEGYFFSSSACVYAADKQIDPDVTALSEADAYPAVPEDGYGWEKLFSERMCRHFREDFGVETRVARFHNVYGPFGTFEGGREKAPAAICRKVADAVVSGRHEIEVWGDGEQTRSFTYIDDCVFGIKAIMESERRRADKPRVKRAGDNQSVSRRDRADHRDRGAPQLQARRSPRCAVATATTT